MGKVLVGTVGCTRPGAMPAAAPVPRPWPAARPASLTSRRPASRQAVQAGLAVPSGEGILQLAEDVAARGSRSSSTWMYCARVLEHEAESGGERAPRAAAAPGRKGAVDGSSPRQRHLPAEVSG